MLEISIKQIMVILDLLTKSWPSQQLLVALVSLTTTNCSIHSKTYYAVPTTWCSDAVTKKELKFGIPSVAHRHKQLATTGNSKLTLPNPLKELSSLSWCIH